MRVRLGDLSRSVPVNRDTRRHPLVRPGDTAGRVGLRLVGRVGVTVARVIARFPRTSFSLFAALLLVDRVGWVLPALALAVLTVAALVWRLACPSSYARWLGRPLRSWWARWVRYAPRWRGLMTRHDLAVVDGDVLVWPGLRKVRSSDYRDALLVKLRAGQKPDHLADASESLAHALGSQAVRVRTHRPGYVWLDVTRRDPFTRPMSRLPVPASAGAVDLTALPIGRREDGALWLLRLLGTHVFVAGATGAGKGSVIWSTLLRLGPAIAAGLVQVWAIDPKGGMELFPGRALFTRYEDSHLGAMVQLLEDAAEFTRDRAARLKGVTRRLTPTVDMPFVLVLVDEFAFITAYVTDKKLQGRADNAVQILASQGRAPGVGLMVALQDPSKEVVPYRNLFPSRIAMRLDEPQQVDMVLGDKMRTRGAYCDLIPESLPGVGYVKLEGTRDPFRVRAEYIDDDVIDGLARDYPAPASMPVPLLGQHTESGLDIAADIPTPARLGDGELSPEWAVFSADYQRRHATNGTSGIPMGLD
ncbi:hypothetical protein BMG523Draft_03063 [Frankia sp. BMG5.23]|nr:hypothetical protein BMG523Draft_03063 [Frankia sp. BMG5.23]